MTTFLGAAGGRELIAWLSDPARPEPVLHSDIGAPARTLGVRRTAAEQLLQRYVLELAPRELRPLGPVADPMPTDALVLTNSERVRELVGPGPLVVVIGAQDSSFDSALADIAARRPCHLRVIADLSDDRLRTSGWSDPLRAILNLHEFTFLAVKAATEWWSGGSVLITVLDGIARPATGLFTGFGKSLALEYPSMPIVATVHDNAALAPALRLGAQELAAAQLLPVVYYVGGQRKTLRARPEPAQPGGPGLTEDSVVLAAGGARGIGAALLIGLARRYRCRIVILGSTELPSAPVEVEDRSEFMRALITGPDRISVAEAGARFDRLRDARVIQETLAELETHCGPGRVDYRRCDLRDTGEVAAVLADVHATHGTIELLLAIAGTNRASAIGTKSLADFRAVRDLKVHSYLNLKEASAAHPPRRWCNFGSFVGFTGQIGETDYAAANDYLNTAAAAAAAGGGGEYTLGWTLWRDIGLGATPIMREFLSNSGQFTAMPTAEGIDHFLAELESGRPAAATVLFGAAERAAITATVPEYLEFCAAPAGPPVLPFIDAVQHLSPTEVVCRCDFDLVRDGYLDLHRVAGYPTLPGTFVPELAAEAATVLVPDRVPVVFEDLRLESFLRVYGPDQPQSKRIHAELVHSDDVESVVAVRVLGDVVAPSGVVLVENKLHFSVRVRLRATPTPPPRWEHWHEHGTEPVPDPYHAPGSGVLLREVFESTTATRIHPLGRRGRLNLDAEQVRHWFPRLLVPSVLLDGLVRIAVLEKVFGRWIPVAIPRSIRRIDLYGAHTDLSLAESGDEVQLYVTPVDLDLEDERPDNRALAVHADGSVLLQVKDIIGAIVGYVDSETGDYLDRRAFDARFRDNH